MIDLNSLFSISDNLYKFLFIGGIVMVIFSITYPLQKKQLIDIEVNTYNKQASLLNKDIEDLYKEIQIFKKSHGQVSSLQIYTTQTNSKESKSIPIVDNLEYKLKVVELENKQKLVNTKGIILNYNLQKVKILKMHVDTYNAYTKWMTCIGIILGTLGLIFWFISTLNTERLKIKEIKKTT